MRVLTLGRSIRRGKSASVESGLGPNDEFTHISVYNNMHPPQLRVKIKYPPDVDDACPSGMLSTCDSDEIFDKIHQVELHHYRAILLIINTITFLLQCYSSWEVFLDMKRITYYSKHSSPRDFTTKTQQSQTRITVKVKFSAWRSNIDTVGIRQAVEEVMNKTGEF